MAELGSVALWVALVAAATAAVAPLFRRARWSLPLLAVASGASATATVVLARALVVSDHRLAYVADFSRRGASPPYRLAGLWGGMAGSLLWWATLVAVAGLVAAWRLADRPGASARPGAADRAAVAAVTGGLLASLLALVLAYADPFETLAVPAIDGAGLVPILEHPAMLYHPPLLYLGLATLVGPFALTVARLIAGRLDDGWLATVRAWSLVPWTLLGLGMVAGAHWAYVEVGWGGYWAWDPVENTALLPWLAVTVLLHATRGAREPRPPVGRAAIAGLACLPFVLALLGNLITRSGAASSVHAFAESRAIGRALGAVVVAVLVAVVVLLVRAARATASGRTDRPAAGGGGDEAERGDDTGPTAVAVPLRGRGSSEGPVAPGRRTRRPHVTTLLASHVAIVGGVLAIVVAGSLWPLAADLVGDDGIAVDGTYFARFVGPLTVAGLALICLVPMAVTRAGRAGRAGSRGRRRAIGPIGAAAAGGIGGVVLVALAGSAALDTGPAVLAAAGGACAASAAAAAARACRGPGRRAVGGHVAHAALGVLVLGIAGTASGGHESVVLAPGDTADVLGHEITHRDVSVEAGPVAGSRAVVADVVVDGQSLAPALVGYPDRGIVLPETSLRSTPVVDVQVALQSAADDGAVVLRVGVHPLQVLVWWGGLGLVAAGVLARWAPALTGNGRGRPSDHLLGSTAG